MSARKGSCFILFEEAVSKLAGFKRIYTRNSKLAELGLYSLLCPNFSLSLSLFLLDLRKGGW